MTQPADQVITQAYADRYRTLNRLPKRRLVAMHKSRVRDLISSTHPVDKWSRDDLITDIMRAEGYGHG